MQTQRAFAKSITGTATAATVAAALLAWAPQAAANETPQYRADQIAQREAADVVLVPGETSTVAHAEAAFIKVHFDRVALGERDALTVASPDGGESHEYGAADVADGELWALSIEGETAEVTLHDAADGVAAAAHIAEYSRGLNDAQLASRPSETRAESICGVDDTRNAVCYRDSDPVAYGASHAVARLIIAGESYCTGWIAGDDRLLTNNHCFENSAEARVTEVQFGYECVRCAGGKVRKPLKVSGDRVLATDFTLDFTLFTVAEPERIAHLPALPLSADPVGLHDKIYIPEHPGGKPLRIASSSTSEPDGLGSRCVVGDERHRGRGAGTDFAYLCDTEGGSSGSPVISRATGKVVGLHHFGGCPNQAVRMDRIYPLIAAYLT
ncbi:MULTISPECIES: trypsin-like serine peptidase [Glycomyces]|uniref:Serine protease n=2 Tax=Glycomyces TaxID=58113 RepID=A0A9X3PLL2_9ACTN|nr:serine protease [Glycomyces lechevalierae]MDA1387741.1 serine protease [Glycomyces lechevalierae]MDR7337372.1 V8-like Glu-specific endopeptidase [Glycomyces lechevalierae]